MNNKGQEEKKKVADCQACGKPIYKGDHCYGYDGKPIACSLECFIQLAGGYLI